MILIRNLDIDHFFHTLVYVTLYRLLFKGTSVKPIMSVEGC